MSKEQLLKSLISGGYLKTPVIVKAFRKIDRADFVPQDIKDSAYIDNPLPIGHGQTISQPLTVAIMFELLDPKPGQKILDIGFGSGWTTVLLAHIVGDKGKVFGIEIIPEIYEFGKRNIEKYPHSNIKLFNQSGREGLPPEAPPAPSGLSQAWSRGVEGFDRILVSASAQEIPEPLKKQLKIGGKLVIPVRNSIFEIERKEDNEFEEKEHFGFTFVPLVKD